MSRRNLLKEGGARSKLQSLFSQTHFLPSLSGLGLVFFSEKNSTTSSLRQLRIPSLAPYNKPPSYACIPGKTTTSRRVSQREGFFSSICKREEGRKEERRIGQHTPREERRREKTKKERRSQLQKGKRSRENQRRRCGVSLSCMGSREITPSEKESSKESSSSSTS